MQQREPLSRPPWRQGQALWLIPVVVLIASIMVADSLLPDSVHLGPLLAVTPAIAALFAGPRMTAAIGILALLALVLAGRLRGGLATLNREVQIVSLVAITVFVVVFCLLRERGQRQLAQVRSVAEAAQRVVLRPVPPRIGPLRLASVYLAAAAGAGIGGDLYAAARIDRSTRLLIGDVRGKGLAAISDAAVLLCAFREAAHRRSGLPGLARRLEASMAREAAEWAQTEQDAAEFFVTAALAEVPDDEPVVHLVSCGHPPPLLLRDGQVLTLQVAAPAPPLGMGEVATAGHVMETFPFATGDRLVLYTDGVIEARDRSGAFYPLAERLPAWRGSDPDALVRWIRDDLLAHVGGRLPDDAAIVAVERQA
ncbi:PP2C family protein-serine/threonine phosphatase [Actinoallomurus bryophytorum]|uniref:Serine phosphatase RsbU (Regulator of sigma subunit) n=1 Tax=Actinoallomurus bryophytorum TaxID=1490222 RepID=A0A543CJH9_9ACTN|nr:PP2C family protein-serine/threonine phosphatase [Actinoallomurus bryophytorum]TQL97249.1 serine phosphatase RsbU (regulator of sigma subunit) [Actinoallomurus bryophytorum]